MTWGLIIIFFLIVWSNFRRKQKNDELELRLTRTERLLQLIVYKTGIDFDEVTDIDLDIQQSKHMKPTKRTAETDTDSFKLMQNKKIKQQKIDAILLDLIQQDKKIEAIKRARELYGYGLVEAKDYVEHLEQNSDSSNPMQYKKVNRQKIDAILLDLIQQGKKIEAIKRARELYDYGLAEAKDYVEHLEQKSDSI